MQSVVLIDADRQSLVTRLGGQRVRLRVHWQPREEAWYCSVEYPPGTPILTGRRIVVDSDIMRGVLSGFEGRLICRRVLAGSGEPGRNAWNDTHRLVYEPA